MKIHLGDIQVQVRNSNIPYTSHPDILTMIYLILRRSWARHSESYAQYSESNPYTNAHSYILHPLRALCPLCAFGAFAEHTSTKSFFADAFEGPHTLARARTWIWTWIWTAASAFVVYQFGDAKTSTSNLISTLTYSITYLIEMRNVNVNLE